LCEETSEHDGGVRVSTGQLFIVQSGRGEGRTGEGVHEGERAFAHRSKSRHPRRLDLSDTREILLLAPGTEYGHEKTECFGPVAALGDATRTILLRSVVQQCHVEIQAGDERVDAKFLGALESSR
jgi:hypothetical protein